MIRFLLVIFAGLLGGCDLVQFGAARSIGEGRLLWALGSNLSMVIASVLLFAFIIKGKELILAMTIFPSWLTSVFFFILLRVIWVNMVTQTGGALFEMRELIKVVGL